MTPLQVETSIVQAASNPIPSSVTGGFVGQASNGLRWVFYTDAGGTVRTMFPVHEELKGLFGL